MTNGKKLYLQTYDPEYLQVKKIIKQLDRLEIKALLYLCHKYNNPPVHHIMDHLGVSYMETRHILRRLKYLGLVKISSYVGEEGGYYGSCYITTGRGKAIHQLIIDGDFT